MARYGSTKEEKIEEFQNVMDTLRPGFKIMDAEIRRKSHWYALLNCGDPNHESYWCRWYDVYPRNQCHCKDCIIDNALNLERIKSQLSSKFDSYNIIGSFMENRTVRVRYHCGNSNHTIKEVSYYSMLRGSICNDCANESLVGALFKESTERLIYEKLEEFNLTIYDWNGCHSGSMPFYCQDKEGYIYCVEFRTLKQMETFTSSWISATKDGRKYAIENIKNYCSLHRPDYTIVSTEYFGITGKYIFEYLGEHTDEGVDRTFKCDLCNFISAEVSHPYITMSKGERKVYKYLLYNDISLISQHAFADCKHKYLLSFDFYLPTHNLCIEYHGEQHYRAVDFFGGDDGFKLNKKRDKIKKDYCITNNIPLIEIPYWEYDNLELFLDEKLKEVM